jgi:hypothetical protein
MEEYFEENYETLSENTAIGNVKAVIEGVVVSTTLPMIPISVIEEMLKQEGFDDLELDNDNINGWQGDFWYYFKHPEKGMYCLSGSLFNGEFRFWNTHLMQELMKHK